MKKHGSTGNIPTAAEGMSRLFDALIIIADVLVGSLVYPRFASLAEGTPPQSQVMLMCGAFLALAGLYVAGLLVNRPNFGAQPRLRLSGMDGVALLFNMVLLAAIFPLLVRGLLGNDLHLALVITLSFGFMAGWVWVHLHVAGKGGPVQGGRKWARRRVAGFLLAFPFVASLSLPMGVLCDGMNLYARGEPVRLSNAVLFPLFAGALLALIAWFLYFVPRKMLKGFMGVNIRSGYFFWALLFDYAFKLSSLNFLNR